ncbi:unnamed protein product, partial [Strongylus vulgaris]
MRLMRYLEQFPFPTGSSNVIIYKDNQEVNVFKTVCSRLSRENSVLTNAEASALVHVISLDNARETKSGFREGRCSSSFRSSLHIETEFSEDVPRSRIVSRYAASMMPHHVSTSSTNSSCSYVDYPQSVPVAIEGLPEDIDTIELPGLRKIPDVESIPNEMCYTVRDEAIDPIELPDFTELCADQLQGSPLYTTSVSSYKTAHTSTLQAGLHE